MEESNSHKRALVDANDSAEGTVAKKMKDFEAVFPTREQFLESCKTQKFSLPMPVIEYIIMNPASPAVYQKLIQSCKWFFIRNPILVVENLRVKNSDEWKRCASKECSMKYECECKSLRSIDVLDKGSKIWLTKRLHVYGYQNREILSMIIPKIYRCTLEHFNIYSADVYLNDLKFFSPGVKDVGFYASFFLNNNGENVPLEDVIHHFPGAENFSLSFNRDLEESICKDYKKFIVACQTFKFMVFVGGPVTFDIEKLYKTMIDSKNRTMFTIIISEGVEDCQPVINQIIATKDFDHVPPVITNIRDLDASEILEEIRLDAFKKLC